VNKILEFTNKYERFITPIFIVGGFILDNLTLRRSDLLAENLLLALYLVIVGVVIVLINKYQNAKFHSILDFLLFFAFGGLFSVFTIFYGRSSFILVSWPFLTLLFGAMLSTEFLRKQYQRLNVQIGIYFLAIFSFLIFHLPTVTGIMSLGIFLISGVAALAIIYLYIFILKSFLNKNLFSHKISAVILGIYIVVNGMYVLNVIPPVPLILKDVEIAHDVVRVENQYKITDEVNDRTRFLGFISFDEKITIVLGQKVYFFSAVFAPIKIKTEIIHHWQNYNEESDEWVTVAKVPIVLQGGRDDGYRSYSYISSATNGKWRVSVETKNGQIIGAQDFQVKTAKSLTGLKTEIKTK